MNRVAYMCLTLAVLCVDISQANAFERSGFTWANLPVTYVINTASSRIRAANDDRSRRSELR